MPHIANPKYRAPISTLNRSEAVVTGYAVSVTTVNK